MQFFISDFNTSLSRADALDTRVREDAAKASPDGKLFDMLSLATRQVFSSFEITAPLSEGQKNATRMFMKDKGMTRSVFSWMCSTT